MKWRNFNAAVWCIPSLTKKSTAAKQTAPLIKDFSDRLTSLHCCFLCSLLSSVFWAIRPSLTCRAILLFNKMLQSLCTHRHPGTKYLLIQEWYKWLYLGLAWSLATTSRRVSILIQTKDACKQLVVWKCARTAFPAQSNFRRSQLPHLYFHCHLMHSILCTRYILVVVNPSISF